MIVRRGNAHILDVDTFDLGPTPVAAERVLRPSGAIVVGQSGARIEDPAKVAARNARRDTTRTGRRPS